MPRLLLPSILLIGGSAGVLWFLYECEFMEALVALAVAAIGGYEIHAEWVHQQDVERFKR